MKQQVNLDDISFDEDVDRLIGNNKQKIKLMSDINVELSARKNHQYRYKILRKETDELENQLRITREQVTKAWNDKIQAERERTVQLEDELKRLRYELAVNADTPGYQQAIKHTDVQDKTHKSNIPSTRANYKNTASRLQQEIKKLQQEVNERKLCLINEIKKKSDLEENVRELRTKIVCHKKSDASSRVGVSIPDLSLC